MHNHANQFPKLRVEGANAASRNLGDHCQLLRLILIHMAQLMALVIVRRREAVIALPRQVESLLNGPKPCHLCMPGIDGPPVSGRADNNVGSFRTSLGHQRWEIHVVADGAGDSTVKRIDPP